MEDLNIKPTWIMATSFSFERWDDWLHRMRLPSLETWAERRDAVDTKTGLASCEYRVPLRHPPRDPKNPQRDDVFLYIRARMPKKDEAA